MGIVAPDSLCACTSRLVTDTPSDQRRRTAPRTPPACPNCLDEQRRNQTQQNAQAQQKNAQAQQQAQPGALPSPEVSVSVALRAEAEQLRAEMAADRRETAQRRRRDRMADALCVAEDPELEGLRAQVCVFSASFLCFPRFP